MNIADYKGVWVFAEQREGKLQKVSLELLGEGKKIADKLGVKLIALLLGENIEVTVPGKETGFLAKLKRLFGKA